MFRKGLTGKSRVICLERCCNFLLFRLNVREVERAEDIFKFGNIIFILLYFYVFIRFASCRSNILLRSIFIARDKSCPNLNLDRDLATVVPDIAFARVQRLKNNPLLRSGKLDVLDYHLQSIISVLWTDREPASSLPITGRQLRDSRKPASSLLNTGNQILPCQTR